MEKGIAVDSETFDIGRVEQQATLSRNALIYGACALLSVALGYLLSDPLSFRSMALVGATMVGVVLPVFLKWYHPILVLSWNASISFFFLPGKPSLAMLMSLVGFTIALATRTIRHEAKFLPDRLMTVSLVFLGGVVMITGMLTGGIGSKAVGSDTYGGKKYYIICLAIMGFFALISRRLPRDRAVFFCYAYFLSTLTAVLGYAVYFAGPSFYFLFQIFPPEVMALRSLEGIDPSGGGITRWGGFSAAGAALCHFLLLRFGVKGLFRFDRPWRGGIFLLCLLVSLLGGFRSVLALIALGFMIQFFLEGLGRTRYLLLICGGAGLALLLAVMFATQLPLSMQRAISFLPVEVDPVAEADAQGSTEWRVLMWKRVVPEIPRYFWLGKGYAIDPVDMYFAEEGVKRGTLRNFEPALVAGDYHSGPLSTIIPFGIFGLVSFCLVLFAGGRILYRNYRRGDPGLKQINTFLFAHFLARIVFYIAVFGSISSDLHHFLGLVGLSICLNGGVGGPGVPAKPGSEEADGEKEGIGEAQA